MVHPIPTSPFIQLNDFCTCIIYICAPSIAGYFFVVLVFTLAASAAQHTTTGWLEVTFYGSRGKLINSFIL